MKTIQEQIAVMQAYADGKKIEFYNRLTEQWEEMANSLW